MIWKIGTTSDCVDWMEVFGIYPYFFHDLLGLFEKPVGQWAPAFQLIIIKNLPGIPLDERVEA